MIIVLNRKITKIEFQKAREVYNDYIKTVVDVDKSLLAVGGEYHVDCEVVLLAQGSNQSDLWGGGYRISTGEIEYMAMSNYKPNLGRLTYEISDEKIREKLKYLTEKYLII